MVLQYNKDKQIIPVFMACDENYAKYMSVAISSIIAGTREQISFYILDGGITENSKEKLKSQLQHTKHSIEFITIDIALFSDFPNIAHFSLNTYFRYLIPNLKTQLDKVLYVDTDMVIQGDIADIYNYDLDKYGLGAVVYGDEEYKSNSYKKYKKKLNLNQQHKYFNAGLLLIDCKYWRENNISQNLFEKTQEMSKILEMPDQDVLNIVFSQNYKQLPAQYNLIVDLTACRYNFNNYISQIKGCIVLHYTGGKGIRPWLHKDIPGAKYFWQAAKNSPFYEDLKFDLLSNQITYLENQQPQRAISRIKLFDMLTICKIKQNRNKKKFYFLGIPLLSIERKPYE